MATTAAPVTVKSLLKIEKYDDTVSQEDIEAGVATPIEVVTSEETLIGNNE